MIHKLGDKATASLPKEYRSELPPIEVRNDYAVLFTWVDEHEDEWTHSSGLVIARTLSRKRDRWGIVVATGPKCSVNVGEYVLPEKTHTPYGGVINGLEVWMAYEPMIALASTDRSVTEVLDEA